MAHYLLPCVEFLEIRPHFIEAFTVFFKGCAMSRKVSHILFVSLSICFHVLSASGQPANKPDLIPKEVFFDTDNVLRAILRNEGDGEVPVHRGKLSIFIDGRPAGEYRFENLADQSFRLPGGSSTLRTSLRIGGKNRRVAVHIDPENQVDESNEIQNTLSRTFTPPVIAGPDFIITDLRLEFGPPLKTETKYSLRVKVQNIGSANSPANLRIRLNVAIDNRVVANLTRHLPTLHAGVGSTTFTIEPTKQVLQQMRLGILRKARVRVELTTYDLFDEIDNTNNVREQILPGGPSLAPYMTLLALPRIKENILWDGSEGVRSYSYWTEIQKGDLNTAILTLERGEPQALLEPPALLDGNFISADDAWKIFIAHVAQSLWVEVHGAVSWHLNDFPDDQIAYLLDGRTLLRYQSSTDRYLFDVMPLGMVTAWNPRICYEFLSNMKMIRSAQLETICALTDWMRGHLTHIVAGENNTDLFGYAGAPPIDKVLYPLAGKLHKTAGCWGTSGFYGGVLRSINIPVSHQTIHLLSDLVHSRPEFPSVDRSMPHGDDPYTAPLTPSGAVIPSSKIFYTSSEMITKFINPSVDCVGNQCNTIGDQASYNSSKDHWQSAYDYMADYILYEYAQYGAGYLNDSLRGPRIGSGIHELAKPYFTDVERATMVAAVENRIREIGEGDLDVGKSKVVARFDRFLGNK